MRRQAQSAGPVSRVAFARCCGLPGRPSVAGPSWQALRGGLADHGDNAAVEVVRLIQLLHRVVRIQHAQKPEDAAVGKERAGPCARSSAPS